MEELLVELIGSFLRLSLLFLFFKLLHDLILFSKVGSQGWNFLSFCLIFFGYVAIFGFLFLQKKIDLISQVEYILAQCYILL